MYQGPAQLDDDGALAVACRQGDLGSCESIVRRYAQEALRTAYLLTDNRDRAWSIARDVFLWIFDELPKLDTDVDLRGRILNSVGQTFLAPYDPEDERPAPLLLPVEGRATRFQVDDPRSRTRQNLALLDSPARLALVLREFNALEVEPIATLLHERPDLTTTTLEASRRRVRNQLGLRSDEPLRAALTDAAFDAPSGDLWLAVADDVAEILQKAGERNRMLTAAVVTAIVTVLVIMLVALFGSSAPDDIDATEARFETNAVNDPPPFPTIAPPRATETNPARSVRSPSPAPSGDVPDTLLMALRANGTSDNLVHLTQFRPRHSVKIQPVGEWPRPTRENWPPVLSPDGGQILIAHFESQAGDTRVLVSSLDSQTYALRWQAELARIPAVPTGEKPDVFVSLAADDERVYATLHYWQTIDLIQLVSLDLEDGTLLDQWPVNIPGSVANDVRVIRPPAGDRVYVFAITQDQPALVGQMHIAFYGYDVADGAQVHGKTLLEVESSRVFYMYEGRVSADGKSLYGVTYSQNSGPLSVQFFDLFTATVQRAIQIPFRIEGGRAPVQEATSHDGRWLYIFSPLSAEMAIVDLEGRELLGIIPLDVQLAGDTRLGAVNLSSNLMQISPDGNTIYAIGALADRSRSSGVWTIDTSTWQIAGHWLPESAPSQILLSGDGRTLYLHERTSPLGIHSHGVVRAVDTASGEQVLDEDLQFLPDATEIQLQSLAGLYRKQYGHSPTVDEVNPADNRAFTSLPAIEATITPSGIATGEGVTIEVRFVDPFSGQLLTEDQVDARYQPPTGVRAILRDDDGEAADIILELGRRGYAEYRGTVVVEEAGMWSLSVVSDWTSSDVGNQILVTRATVEVRSRTSGPGVGSLSIQSNVSWGDNTDVYLADSLMPEVGDSYARCAALPTARECR